MQRLKSTDSVNAAPQVLTTGGAAMYAASAGAVGTGEAVQVLLLVLAQLYATCRVGFLPLHWLLPGV